MSVKSPKDKVRKIPSDTISQMKSWYKTNYFVPVKKKRKIDVWLKILFWTCLEESFKANIRDGTENSEKGKKEVIYGGLSLSKKLFHTNLINVFH